MPEERRQFERLNLDDEARVLDESGADLGTVVEASGGGMAMKASSMAIAQTMELGRKLRVRIYEPHSKAETDMTVCVRYREGVHVGFEFTN